MNASDLRPPVLADAAAVAALRSTHSPEQFTLERLLREWHAPGFDLEQDARIQGEIAGYAAVEHLGDDRFWLELYGDDPALLLDWASHQVGSGRLFSGAWQSNKTVKETLERHGFRFVRHSYRMAISLQALPPEPKWPDEISLRTCEPGDERAVYETHMETFEDSWEHVHQSYEEWAHWTVERPGFEPALWLLAVSEDRIAGIALCRIHDEDPATGWIAVLGVRRPWRRHGLGRALLLASFGVLRDRGCARAVLGVDAESLTGANRLYESAGMGTVDRFEIYEKVL